MHSLLMKKCTQKKKKKQFNGTNITRFFGWCLTCSWADGLSIERHIDKKIDI